MDYEKLEKDILKNYYTIEQAYKILGITRRSIYNYIYDNKLKAIKYKNKIYVDKKSVEKYIFKEIKGKQNNRKKK